jgi:hypothetical protein
MDQGSAQGMYSRLESQRHTILERARDASRLTIPTLVVDEGHTYTNRLPTPYQSVGARGVNNMASALLLSLLPPNTPFFRLVIDQAAMNDIEQQANGAEIKTQFDMSLAKIERSVAQEIETRAYRVSVFEALRQLIVAGNVLIHMTDDGEMRIIPLTRYVVKRDAMGHLKTVIVKETMAVESLPEDAQALVAASGDPLNTSTVDLYTCMKAVGDGTYMLHQEVAGSIIPDSVGTVKEEDSPFIVLRMNRVDGEDYGRGYVEQYIGDLKSLEGLMQSIVEGSAAAAKVLFMVAPNGTTRIRKLAEAPNGGIVEGSAADVSVLQINKQADFATAYQVVQTLQDRLSYAFLLTDNAIRNAERVTAAEVRLVTQSIERQLGGIYSVLSQEFQLPMVKKIMTIMARSKRLPKLPSDLVHPAIVTGVEALGRGNDLNKMDEFLVGVGQLLGPEVLTQFVNLREYMDRRATALGIDSDGLIKTEEEMQEEQQQAQMQQAMLAMGPMMSQAGQAPPQA